jgi:transcriptional regulator of acetoin/glycerol metabolism
LGTAGLRCITVRRLLPTAVIGKTASAIRSLSVKADIEQRRTQEARFIAALKKHGTQIAAARALGIPRGTMQRRLR